MCKIPFSDKTLGADGREYNKPTYNILEADPFDAWFSEHVLEGDALEVLSKDSLKYDLAIVDPPYGITKDYPKELLEIVELEEEMKKIINLIIHKNLYGSNHICFRKKMCSCVSNEKLSDEGIQDYIRKIKERGYSSKDFRYITYTDDKFKRPLCPICGKFINETQLIYLKKEQIL